MSDDNELVLWGTIDGWSKKLGIAEDVLRERFKDLPTQLQRARQPNDSTSRKDTYAEPDVLEACADLLRPEMVDTDNLSAKEIGKQIKEESEGP